MTMHDCKCLCILCVTDMLIDTVDINRKMDYLCGNVARMFKKRTGCVCVRVFFFMCVFTCAGMYKGEEECVFHQPNHSKEFLDWYLLIT